MRYPRAVNLSSCLEEVGGERKGRNRGRIHVLEAGVEVRYLVDKVEGVGWALETE